MCAFGSNVIILHLQGLFMTRATCPVRVIIRATLRSLVGMDDLILIVLNDERSRTHAANQFLCVHLALLPYNRVEPCAYVIEPRLAHIRSSCFAHRCLL